MVVTAELPLICSAAALALVAVSLFLAPRSRTSTLVAVVSAATATVTPLLLGASIEPARSAGRALWEWSAAGGPTVQASYRFDGIAAVALAVGAAYAAAGLFGAARATERHPLLPAAILANGLVFFAVAVTEDLVAGTVVLGVLASITILATLAVAPLPATTRLSAYLAVGIQFFVLAALLISRYGAASFRFDSIVPGAISPGSILAASIGAALFAGLYPFIPWHFQTDLRAPRLERLRGIVTMPAGVAATVLLLRLLSTTRADVTTIALPDVPAILRVAVALISVAAVAGVALRRGRVPRRAAVVCAIATVLLAAYPALHWSHLILAAALLCVLYATIVSLALPEQWDVVRYDVALAAFWIALAIGTPTAIAGGLFILVADAVTALAESVWDGSHGSHVLVIAGSAATVTGLVIILTGTLDATDRGAQGLALVDIFMIAALVLVHAGRRIDRSEGPIALDGLGAAVAAGFAVLLGLLVAVPISQGVTLALGRRFAPIVATPLAFPAAVALATLLVIVARSLRPFVPELAPVADRLRAFMTVVDPVGPGHAAFAALDTIASRTTATFALFEERAGVWLATVLIIAVLVWSVR